MNTYQYTFQDKQAIIGHLAFLYKKQSLHVHDPSKIFQENQYTNFSQMQAFIAYIDGALELLEKEHKDILVRDFFQGKERNWWSSYYSKTTYYRIKSTAMNEFLRCL